MLLITKENASNRRWRPTIAHYKKKYINRSGDFIVPLLALLFIGLMFVLLVRAQGGIGFIFLVVGSGILIYWIKEIKIMARTTDGKMLSSRDSPDQKDWLYDLIKNNDEMVFVAEVPGPEDQINVGLTDGLLRIKGGQNFARDVPIEVTDEMKISEYKYRNGVLTIKIQKV
jgi:hypothetical protein